MKFLKYTREILITGLVIFVVLLFVKPCGREKLLAENRYLKEQSKSLEAKVKADSIARNEERKAFVREKQETEGRRQLAIVEKTEADKKVQSQRKDIDRLIAAIRNNSGKPVDTADMVIVSKKYKTACDSVPDKFQMYERALQDKDSAIAEWSDILAYEIQIRDEELFKEMNYSDSLKVNFVRQTQLLKSALKQGKPRGRVLGGISVLGNQNQFLSGAGVVLAYQTKGGKQYQLSPKFIKVPGAEAEVFYEGSVLFTIFK